MSAVQPKEVWIGRGDDKLGPHALDRFLALHAEGKLHGDDLLWWDGLGDWLTLDDGLQQLGIAAAFIPAHTSMPPPLPAASTPTPLPGAAHRTVPRRSDGGSGNLVLGFVALIGVAVLVAAGFTFLRQPNLRVPAFTGNSSAVGEALAAATMYKTAYAEYVMTNDKVPHSLDDIGIGSAPYGGLMSVRIDAGTLLLETSAGVLALQPYRNANYQILFRCGAADPPPGMDALGQVDSNIATTVAASDLPEACR